MVNMGEYKVTYDPITQKWVLTDVITGDVYGFDSIEELTHQVGRDLDKIFEDMAEEEV
jgi:hypothetical protein